MSLEFWSVFLGIWFLVGCVSGMLRCGCPEGDEALPRHLIFWPILFGKWFYKTARSVALEGWGK
jgi:hypothetical protein